MRMLLNGGASPNVALNNGKTLLASSAEVGDVAVTQMLVDAGADLDTLYLGLTPFDLALRCGMRDCAKVIQGAEARRVLLLRRGRKQRQQNKPQPRVASSAEKSHAEILMRELIEQEEVLAVAAAKGKVDSHSKVIRARPEREGRKGSSRGVSPVPESTHVEEQAELLHIT